MDIELTLSDHLVGILSGLDVSFIVYVSMLIAFVVVVLGGIYIRGKQSNANVEWAKILKDDLRHTEERIIENVKTLLNAFREEMKGLLTEHDKGNQRDFAKTYKQFDEIKRDIKELRGK